MNESRSKNLVNKSAQRAQRYNDSTERTGRARRRTQKKQNQARAHVPGASRSGSRRTARNRFNPSPQPLLDGRDRRREFDAFQCHYGGSDFHRVERLCQDLADRAILVMVGNGRRGRFAGRGRRKVARWNLVARRVMPALAARADDRLFHFRRLKFRRLKFRWLGETGGRQPMSHEMMPGRNHHAHPEMGHHGCQGDNSSHTAKHRRSSKRGMHPTERFPVSSYADQGKITRRIFSLGRKKRPARTRASRRLSAPSSLVSW